MNYVVAGPLSFDMVDSLGPDSLAACSGSINGPLAGIGGSAASIAASSETFQQQDGAVVHTDPIVTLGGSFRRGGCSAASARRGGSWGVSRQSCYRQSSASAAGIQPIRQGRPRWNSCCSATGWIVAPRPRDNEIDPRAHYSYIYIIY